MPREAGESTAEDAGRSTSGDAGSAASVPPEYPWERVLDWLRGERDRFSADLETAHAALLARAETEDSSLVARLSPVPPKPRPQGYGILPELRPNPETKTTPVRKRIYSLETLSTEFAAPIRDAALLARQATEDPQAPLAEMVDRFVTLRDKLRNLEDHIAYHTMWQKSAAEDVAFFRERNAIQEQVVRWRELVKSGEDPAQADSLLAVIRNRIAPFQPTPGLAVRREDDGEQVLPVQIATDIDDPAFLERFRSAVDEIYNDAPAARERRFRIDVSFRYLAPEQLYPGGAPARGDPIDEKDHLRRFPEGSLVLTTGARRTHAYVGWYLQLGSEPTNPRRLAHEFGHLLGFSDAYLRASKGSPQDPFGSVLIEWTGLLDDLMGSPAHGTVSASMIDRLMRAYGGSSPDPASLPNAASSPDTGSSPSAESSP